MCDFHLGGAEFEFCVKPKFQNSALVLQAHGTTVSIRWG